MEKITSELKNVKTAAIAGHIHPDGDCTGSCLGLYNYLKENYPEIRTDVYLEQPRESFQLLAGTDEIRTSCQADTEYDVFFLLDTSTVNRIGVAGDLFRNAKKRICIDHHISNPGFGDINIIKADMSSASEVLYGLLEEDKISKNTAEALYLGIVHDTGVFKFSCTSPDTMRVAGKLMEHGLDCTRIIDETFYQKTYVQNQILGRCLMESVMLMNGKCIVGIIRQSEMNFYGVTAKELDGIVDQLRLTKGVEVAIFVYATGTQEYKVSMRSNGPVDVNAVAGYFGGGGHIKAAGCTMQGSVYDVVNNLTEQIEKEIKEKCGD